MVVSPGGEEALATCRYPFPLLIERRSGTGGSMLSGRTEVAAEPSRKLVQEKEVVAMRLEKDPGRLPTAGRERRHLHLEIQRRHRGLLGPETGGLQRNSHGIL
jgi:hypothetical protein